MNAANDEPPRESAWSRWRADRRQLRFPPALRIAAPTYGEVGSLRIEHALRAFDAATRALRERVVVPHEARLDDEQRRLVVEAGTSLWRLKHKLLPHGAQQPSEELRPAARHFQSTWDAFARAGVEIVDHTGQHPPTGGVWSVRVLAYQPTAGIGRDTVIDTLRPSILMRGQVLQNGEVIVGQPETPPPPAATVETTTSNAASAVTSQDN
jgi:hypothetical protein